MSSAKTTTDKALGRNISYTLANDTLILSIPVNAAVQAAAPMSKSGKSAVIATTNGNVSVTLPGGKDLKIGINAYFNR